MKPSAAVPRCLFLLAVFVLLLLPARTEVDAVPMLSAGVDETPSRDAAVSLQPGQGTDDQDLLAEPRCTMLRRAFMPIVVRK